MSTPRKPSATEELEHIEDALIETLLSASEEELREEMVAAGIDPDACIAGVEAAIASARGEASRPHLERGSNMVLTPSQVYFQRRDEYLAKLDAMSLDERKEEVRKVLRKKRFGLPTRDDFWPQLVPALDALVASGEVVEKRCYRLADPRCPAHAPGGAG